MKLVDVKRTIFILFNKENNKEGPKFKVGYHVRISKYKKIGQRKFLWLKKLKI